MKEVYDLVILGGGSAGYAAAIIAAEKKKSVLIIEKGPFGGLCILKGCMPSKTLLYSARLNELMKKAHKLGIVLPQEPVVNLPYIIHRKDKIIQGFADYKKEVLEKNKKYIRLVYGTAEFVSPKEVRVNNIKIKGKYFLIATGSKIFIPPIEGLQETGYLTSDEALEIKKLPESLVILGAGAIAMELGYYFQSLGAKVTILQKNNQILDHMDHASAKEVEEIFRKKGMQIYTGVDIKRISKDDTKKKIEFLHKTTKKMIVTDEILLALGRRPNLEPLNVEKAGIKLYNGKLKTNKFLQTNVKHIYAAGDASGNLLVVNVAVEEGKIAAENMFSSKNKSLNYNLVPMAIFCHPEIAWIGLTQRQAEEQKLKVKIGKLPYEDLGKAVCYDETEGYIKFIINPKDKQILGVEIVGYAASDIIHEALPLLYYKATLEDLKKMPHIHPTFGEIYSYLVDEMT